MLNRRLEDNHNLPSVRANSEVTTKTVSKRPRDPNEIAHADHGKELSNLYEPKCGMQLDVLDHKQILRVSHSLRCRCNRLRKIRYKQQHSTLELEDPTILSILKISGFNQRQIEIFETY